MWDLYLGYCQAAFLDRHIGDVQLLLAKSGARRFLSGDPLESDSAAGMDPLEYRDEPRDRGVAVSSPLTD